MGSLFASGLLELFGLCNEKSELMREEVEVLKIIFKKIIKVIIF
jgi:hypothetical protein